MERLLSPELMPLTLGGLGLLLLLLIAAVVVVMRSAGRDEVSDRLSEFAGRGGASEQGPANPRQALERIDKVVSKSKQGSNVARDLARADVKLTVAEFFLVKLAAAALGVAIGLYLGRASGTAMIAAAIVGAVVLSFVPNFYVSFMAKKRLAAFNNLLGDTISMMSNALRGGYSFLMTLDMVAKEAPYPVNVEFRRVVQEVGLGRSTEEALSNLQRRVPSEDLDLLITAVNIQMEVGGNLAQILDTIGHTIRERVRIKGEINTLTAQGRISAWVITGLPIGLAIFISVVNPDYMAPIFSFGMPPENWCCLPVASLVMIGIGFVAIMKIMDIEV
jgi:tight adherence protein B